MSNEGTPERGFSIDWKFLAGFIPEEQSLAYVRTSSLEKTDSEAEWIARIRRARSHVAKITGRANLNPSIAEIAARHKDYLEKVQLNPIFKDQIAEGRSFRFASVELSKLLCSQGTLNLEHIQRLMKEVPEPADYDATIKFCLPIQEDSQGTRSFWSTSAASHSTVLVSENLNFRVTGLAQGDDRTTGRKLTAVVYGFGPPYLVVGEYRGRYMITNGHHRAYSLLKKGHEMVPCLILSHDNYPYKGPRSYALIPPEVVMSDTPPLLADFDSPAAITVSRRRSIVVINVHAEAQEVAI